MPIQTIEREARSGSIAFRQTWLPGWLWLLLLLPSGLAGQSRLELDIPPAEVAGLVVDAESRMPIEGAIVVLRRRPAADDPPFAANDTILRSAMTGSSGEYRFRELPPGLYRLDVNRIGYFGTTIHVDLRSGVGGRFSVGLEVDPISLNPLHISGGAPEPYGRLRAVGTTLESGRALTDQLRQDRYLVSDARVLTHAEVLEAITLAETDLFRALQRVPGVSTRDDYTATMWTRGAGWDLTRVYFDGLPLYNPTHAGWLFSAINPDAIGSASFHPGHRSARWGEGASAVLDLQSRSGRAGGPLHGNAELSLASARLALDGSFDEGAGRWMVAARRSHVDLLASIASSLMGDPDLRVPYDFSDIVARADHDLGGTWSIEASGILELDHIRGDIEGLLRGNRGHWGNRAGRVTLARDIAGIRVAGTAGRTDFSTKIFETTSASASRPPTIPMQENGIAHRLFSLDFEPRRGADSRRWAAGIQLMSDSVSFEGPFTLFESALEGGAQLLYGSSLRRGAVWGETRWSPTAALEAIGGARMEFGDSVHNGGRYRLAPRLAVRARPAPGLILTSSWSRAFQYTQDVSPAAGPIGPQLHLTALWVVASPSAVYPALRTDLATLGVEREFGLWSFVGNVYGRQSSGLKVPNPLAGPLTFDRSRDAEASNDAYGFELSARRTARRWLGSIGYAFGRSTMELVPRDPGDPTFRFSSSADIRHGIDATAITQIGDRLRLGGAFTFGSGVPFTAVVVDDMDAGQRPVRFGAANAERTPSYASLDAMLEYSRSFNHVQFNAYGQIRNLTNRSNAVTYVGSRDCSVLDQNECAGREGVVHRFDSGLPILPLIGIRVAF